MRRTFVSNLILIVALNLLVKPFYLLVVEAEIQNRVGAENFGNYFALINFSFLLNIILDLGITNWNTRNLAQNNQVLQKHFSHIISLRLLLAGAFAIVVLAVGLILNYSMHQFEILAVLAFNQVLASGVLYLRSNLSALHLFRQDSIVSVLDRFILVLAMGALLWGGIFGTESFSVEWLVWGQTFAYGITMIVGFVLVKRNVAAVKISFDRVFNRAVLKQSFPYALLIFLSMIAYRVDAVMLERMQGAEEAGIYAMGFRFYEAFNMIAFLFAGLLLPIFSRMLSRKENVAQLTTLAFRILFSGVLIVCSLCFFLAGFILETVYDLHIAEALPAFQMLMIGVIFFSLQYVFGTLLTANGDLKILIRIATLAMFMSILINFIFIPLWGALGAAYANCITQFIALAAQILFVSTRFRWSLQWPIIASTVLYATGVIFFSRLITINIESPLFGASIVCTTGIAWAFVTRMFSLRQFMQLVRSVL
ncbi:MAG: oligosaccharide flippase family protein [Flavobacteriales bacterium]|nr:oligosaccharide flippase family protein [Flavobacteriales bacterium]